MKSSLVIYTPPTVDTALFIQRVVIAILIGVLTAFFNRAILENFTAGPALVENKNERLSEEIAVLRNEFFSLLLEIRDLRNTVNHFKTHGFNELREELIHFSVDVWKEDIQDLQEDVYNIKNKINSQVD
jgi:uncharacterized protein YlxW (UPF0749 family)